MQEYNSSEAVEELLKVLKKVYFLKTPGKLEDFLKGEKKVLSYICHNSPVTAGQVSGELKMTAARIAGILRSLEKKGYIIRESGESDKRMVVVTATERGMAVREQGEKDLKSNLYMLTEIMGEEKTRSFISALRDYADAAEIMDSRL
ncbi:MAG: transcriptional regulator [Ruminococcus sp.]|nr:transcriptional regulator [Ruminococcus sp.]